MVLQTQSLNQFQKQTQQLVLAPQLRQSLKILQSAALDLRAAIQEELQSNPVLEELPMTAPNVEVDGDGDSQNGQSDDGTDEIDRKLEVLNQLDEDWRDSFATNGNGEYSPDAQKKRDHFFNSLVNETSLMEHLMGQAELSDCTEEERTALEQLVGNLDDRGFLSVPLPEISMISGIPVEQLERAHALLKTFDPPGIGATDLRECLLLQLKQFGKTDSPAAAIVRDHMDLLMRRRIPELARKLGIDPGEAERAIDEIASLDPSPGRKFGEDHNQVIIPDVTVEKDGDNWLIHLNNDYIPRLRISSSYKEMIAAGKLSRKEKEYIHDKMRSGKFLINSIEQRQQTVEKITRELLRIQREFFEEGVSKLRPLTMTQVADAVGVHETTVSRAIANKYIQTPHGVFEFKFFFTPGYESGDGQSVSNKTIKDRIATLIDQEPPHKPLSDQRIVELLAEKDIKIARRTVAKYREAMGILPTNLRRHYK